MADEPEILYHYTTAKGLIGILKSKMIWATDRSFLDDRSEASYCVEVIDQAIDMSSC